MTAAKALFANVAPRLALGALSVSGILSNSSLKNTRTLGVYSPTLEIDAKMPKACFSGSGKREAPACLFTVLPPLMPEGRLQGAGLSGERFPMVCVSSADCVLTSVHSYEGLATIFVRGLSRAIASLQSDKYEGRTLVFLNKRDTSKPLSVSMGATWKNKEVPAEILSHHPHAAASPPRAGKLVSGYGRELVPWSGKFSDGLLPSSTLTITWNEGTSASIPQFFTKPPPEGATREEWLSRLTCWLDLLVAVPLAALGASGFADNVDAAGGPGVYCFGGERGGSLRYAYLSLPPFWARSEALVAALVDQAAFAVNTMEDPDQVGQVIEGIGGMAVVEQAASGKNPALARELLPKVFGIMQKSNRALNRPRGLATPQMAATFATLAHPDTNLSVMLPQVNGCGPAAALHKKLSGNSFFVSFAKELSKRRD